MDEEEEMMLKKYGGIFELPDDYVSNFVKESNFSEVNVIAVSFMNISYFIRARNRSQKTSITKSEVLYMLEKIRESINENY